MTSPVPSFPERAWPAPPDISVDDLARWDDAFIGEYADSIRWGDFLHVLHRVWRPSCWLDERLEAEGVSALERVAICRDFGRRAWMASDGWQLAREVLEERCPR
jgi:hypothetical protein